MNIEKIATKIGIDWDKVKFTKEDLSKGVEVEREHAKDPETSVVSTDEELAKIAWAHLKESPKYYDELAKLEKKLVESHEIFDKIRNKKVTVEDFDRLISESTPESIRNRLRRRINPSTKVAKNHTDNQSGHTRLGGPTLAKRVQPKRKPSNQQSHGLSKIAHKHSTKSQNNDGR